MKYGDTVYVISGIVRAVEYRGQYTCNGRTFVSVWMTSFLKGQGDFKIYDFPRKFVFTTKEKADKALFMRVLQGED